MKPIPEVHRVSEDLFVWHGYNPGCKTDCSSTAVRTPDGWVLIDPLRLEENAFRQMVGKDKVAAVLLTSGNHERDSAYEKQRLAVPVYAPEGARGEVAADHWIKDGEVLFQAVKTIGLPGGGPGETAYLAPGVLIVGDALINLDGLAVLPDKYCENPRTLGKSLGVLASLDFEIVCFAHGLPIVQGAKEKIVGLVEGM